MNKYPKRLHAPKEHDVWVLYSTLGGRYFLERRYSDGRISRSRQTYATGEEAEAAWYGKRGSWKKLP
jgi:hypothetical protein